MEGKGGYLLFAICFLLQYFLNHISRPATHLHVNPAHILSYEPQGKDLQANEEKKDSEQSKNPLYLRPNEEASDRQK